MKKLLPYLLLLIGLATLALLLSNSSLFRGDFSGNLPDNQDAVSNYVNVKLMDMQPSVMALPEDPDGLGSGFYLTDGAGNDALVSVLEKWDENLELYYELGLSGGGPYNLVTVNLHGFVNGYGRDLPYADRPEDAEMHVLTLEHGYQLKLVDSVDETALDASDAVASLDGEGCDYLGAHPDPNTLGCPIELDAQGLGYDVPYQVQKQGYQDVTDTEYLNFDQIRDQGHEPAVIIEVRMTALEEEEDPEENPDARPFAVDDSAETDQDVPVEVKVLVNDIVANDFLIPTSLQVEDEPTHGTTEILYTFDANNPNLSPEELYDGTAIKYTPELGFSGEDSFTYSVADKDGLRSNVATVTLTVNSIVPRVNEAPTANNDSATTTENIPVYISVLANDLDDLALNAQSLKIVTHPSHGTAVLDLNNGQITYSPQPGFLGSDSFSYNVEDNEGALSNTASVSVNVTTTLADDYDPDCDMIFTDVSRNNFAYAFICNLADMGILSGRTYQQFVPTDQITRAEMIKIYSLSGGLDIQELTEDSDYEFADVAESKWYYPYVTAFAEVGALGLEDGSYVQPNRDITRRDAFIWLANLYELTPDEDLEIEDYCEDVSGNYILGAKEFLALRDIEVTVPTEDGDEKTTIATGYPDGTCRLNDFIQRDEASALVMRVILSKLPSQKLSEDQRETLDN